MCTKVSLQTLIRGVNVKFNYANALRAGDFFLYFFILIKLIFWLGDVVE